MNSKNPDIQQILKIIVQTKSQVVGRPDGNATPAGHLLDNYQLNNALFINRIQVLDKLEG